MNILIESQISFHSEIIKTHNKYIKLLQTIKESIKEGITIDINDKTQENITETKPNNVSVISDVIDTKYTHQTIDEQLDYDQDMIWDRIRKSHPNEYKDEMDNKSNNQERNKPNNLEEPDLIDLPIDDDTNVV